MHTFTRKLILLAFLLAACQPNTLTEVSPTRVLSSPTISTTLTQPVIEAPKPTSTEHIVTVSTPIMNEHFVAPPEWVRNPDNSLLLLPYLDDLSSLPSKFMLINPKDGEQIKVELNWKFHFYYWRDSNHAVFLESGWCFEDNGSKHLAELDILKGTLWQGKAAEYSEPIKDCSYLLKHEEDNITFNKDSPELTIDITDPATGQTISLTNSNDGVSDISYSLSPNKNYIAVVQVRGDYQPSEVSQPEFGNKISIYSLPDRKLLLTYDENQDISSHVTFIDNEDLVYVRGNTPCMVVLQTLEKKCIYAISDKFPNSTVIVEGRLSFSNKLFFLSFQGGFCLYDFLSGNLDCPTDHFPSMDGQTVINYSISPDEKYLLFAYDSKGCPVPWCDNFLEPHWAVTDMEGKHLFEIGIDASGLSRPIRPYPWQPLDK